MIYLLINSVIFIYITVINPLPGCCSSVEVLVEADKPLRKLTHFWRSSGFCPPQPHSDSAHYDLSIDQQLNLALIGSTPHSGLQQVRIHWMLELISARSLKIWVCVSPAGFELMGSVRNTFTDFEDKEQVVEWRRLVYLIANRYTEKYGLSYVSQWNFETWNEPNNHDFDNISITIQGFLNYYDACSEGLRLVSPVLKFGGPGDACRDPPRSPYCWALLQHCYNGTNYFTGQRGVRLDYIALHKKGGNNTLPILQQEVATAQEIQRRFPDFRSLPIYNDEADPLVGWNKPLTWRADVTYAAMVVKVDTHTYTCSVGGDLLIANQNNTFTQRTLTARFQINNTNPAHVQLLRKPVLTVMGLLALLGELQVQAQVFGGSQVDGSVGVLASVHLPQIPHTADSWQSTVLIYNSRDNLTSNSSTLITLHLTGAPPPHTGHNPYELWRKMGSPDYPTLQQLTQLRNQEDAQREGPQPFPAPGVLTLTVKLPVPSILLIHVCSRATLTPGQVRLPTAKPCYIFTDCFSLCLTIMCVCFSLESGEVCGFYRVRVVDYWDRAGEYSPTEKYTQLC
uniref:Alpha-L-iduronidase n=1 Tax=Astyanax mexicanus TaxID=7994 RepID=A0A3B1IM18_ASTMX